jgi:hypothetical protein
MGQSTHRMRIERRIVKATIKEALAAGYEVTVCDGEEFPLQRSTDAAAILKAMFSTDEDGLWLYKPGAEKRDGLVYFVYGNDGWDVINDYTVTLEGMLKPVQVLCDQLEARYG